MTDEKGWEAHGDVETNSPFIFETGTTVASRCAVRYALGGAASHARLRQIWLVDAPTKSPPAQLQKVLGPEPSLDTFK